MFEKKVTLLVYPKDGRRLRTYTIPRTLPLALLITVLMIIAGLIGYAWNIRREFSQVLNQEPDMQRLRQKAVQQNLQIQAFADKIQVLEQEMIKLRQQDRKLRAMTGKAPVITKGLTAAMGGSDRESVKPRHQLKASTENLVRQMHRDVDRLLAECSVREMSLNELSGFFEDTKSLMASIPDSWPLKGPMTSFFGYRLSPSGGSYGEFHRGVDICAPMGTPIVAPADGIVVSIDWTSGYGMILVINHGYGVVTRFAHISQSYVVEGQRVRRGEKIAAVGATGRTTGTHLHYEVILNGIPVNPLNFLEAKKQAR
ncbi:MAG: M23 family metallopeptidase [Thermodesulfobacteriota bacterium]